MKSKLIVALDVASYQEAVTLIEAMPDTVDTFKVGSQLFTRVGPQIVHLLRDRNKRCFLDL